jgi:NAD(P)-dependent dehydrogenase (short-subunit alcohol dehydrogenase family)
MNVLITGAAGGLGRQLALEFRRAGACLALVDRVPLEDVLPAGPAGLRPEGDRGVALQTGGSAPQLITADLADPLAPAAIVERLRRKWDHLDALINNAAIAGPVGKCWDNDWDAWQACIQVDLIAPVALCRLCIPWMKRGGAIVNLAGGGATGPRPNFTAYATAKAGIVRFTETLAKETGELGIRVNAVSPGVMNTAILAPIVQAGAEHAGAEYEKVLEIQRAGGETPERAAALIRYLASPESEGITGRLISAVWDPWQSLHEYAEELRGSDIYTLRRIVPEDRGKQWNR